MGTKLELVWPGKYDRFALVRDEATGKPVQVPYESIQPRILIEQECYGNPESENLLIGGENLFALTTLLASGYADQVKLVYIDPPFNTGNTFSHYDDGLELSLYLTVMRDRLSILQRLLAPDGLIFVHLDNNAVFHVRMLMDELFGRDRFVNDIIWKRSDSHKSSRKASVIHDTILVYAKTPAYFWREVYIPYSDKRIATAYKNRDSDGRQYTLSDLMAPGDRPCTKSDYIWKGVTPKKGRHWSYTLEEVQDLERQGLVVWNKNGVPKLKVYLDEAKGVPMPSMWVDLPMLKGGAESRGFDTQKPEALLQRILTVATSPGDLVLDCFVGSGTTASVAHKMDRRWIGIEAGAQAASHCLPRLKEVVDGTDQSGISKTVPPLSKANNADKGPVENEEIPLGWTGGAGFRYYTLGKALMEQDAALGVWRLNYDNGKLIESICLQEGYKLCADGVRHGVKGRHFAHITEQFVTQEYLDALASSLTEDEALTIYYLKAARKLHLPSNVVTKRIPQALLGGNQ